MLLCTWTRLYGDYESLATGYAADALVDFTGGVAEKFVLSEMNLQVEETRYALYEDLRFASENNALLLASIAVS